MIRKKQILASILIYSFSSNYLLSSSLAFTSCTGVITKDQNLDKQKLAVDLFDIGAIKFGEFKLKSGVTSPIYIDLRMLVSYPEVLKNVAVFFWDMANNLDFNLICGVPLAGLPIASAISLENNFPMIMLRPEAKDHGTMKIVEGQFNKGDNCIVIEDLITSGISSVSSAKRLALEGLVVKHILVLIDREQGGAANVASSGYQLHSVFTMNEILQLLFSAGKITQDQINFILNYINNTKV